MRVEDFLQAAQHPIHIVGGSPLLRGPLPDRFISINAKHAACGIPVPGAFAAAINGGRDDASRAKAFEFVLQPNPDAKERFPGIIRTERRHAQQLLEHRGVQPTTFFALAVICEIIGVPCELWGIDGWASKHHDGDLEMSYLKRFKHVTVHDPRTPW